MTDVGAADAGNIELLRWHKQQGLVFSSHTMAAAASNGHQHACEYLHSVGCPCERCMQMAASYKQWHIVRWMLCSTGYEVDPTQILLPHGAKNADGFTMTLVLYKAASRPNSPLSVKFFLNAERHYEEMLQIAGAYGNLDVAIWLKGRGTRWPDVLQYSPNTTYETTATPWTAEMVTWARAEGCTSPIE
jgi:hypothetical protein